jgi:hypothetical protein
VVVILGEIGLWLRRDRSRVLAWQGGAGSDRNQRRQSQVRFHGDYRQRSRSRQVHDNRVSKNVGGSSASSVRRGVTTSQDGERTTAASNIGIKVSYYFTNIPEFMSVFQLRQYFEVCGILSNVYLARHRNFRGQVYGFMRFLNVKTSDKLSQALNNVWIGQFRIWAREARIDRFAQFDSKPHVPVVHDRRQEDGRKERTVGKERVVVTI